MEPKTKRLLRLPQKERRVFLFTLAASALLHLAALGLFLLYGIQEKTTTPEVVEIAIVADPEPPPKEISKEEPPPEEKKPLPPPPVLEKPDKPAEAAAAPKGGGASSTGAAGQGGGKPPGASSSNVERRRPDPVNLGGEQGVRGAVKPGQATVLDEKKAQTLRDIMLTQIVRHWRPPDQVRGQNAVVEIVVEVLPNGMLAPPLSADRPLEISKAVNNYANLNPLSQRVLYDLVQAMRVAQPFDLPKDALKSAPWTIRLDFAFDQIPRN